MRRPEPSYPAGNTDASFDDETDTERLVAKSHELTNLTAIGSAPFILRASLFFNDPSGDPRVPPARGSYTFTWQSADKWREDAELLHLKQTEIANGNTLWTKRNAPFPSFSYWWTHNAMEIMRGVVYHFDSRTRVEIAQVSGRNVVCARNGGVRVTQELCLDTRTGLPLLQYDSTLHIQYLFADWAQWGNHWYPRTIKGLSGTEAVMQIEIANVAERAAGSEMDCAAGGGDAARMVRGYEAGADERRDRERGASRSERAGRSDANYWRDCLRSDRKGWFLERFECARKLRFQSCIFDA